MLKFKENNTIPSRLQILFLSSWGYRRWKGDRFFRIFQSSLKEWYSGYN